MAVFKRFSGKDKHDLNKRINSFTLDVYKELSNGTEDNLFFSPLSVSIALSMTLMGCKGNTKAQLEDVLRLKGLKTQDIMEAYTHLMSRYSDLMTSSSSSCEFKLANMIYVSKMIKEDFKRCLKERFKSSAEVLNFGDPSARLVINKDVEKVTNSKIKDLIGKGDLNSLTRIVLVNAIYFKGEWLKKFHERMTTDSEFWTSTSTSIIVPMMYQNGKFKYSELEGAKMLIMDYKGGDFSMVFLLPDEIEGLRNMEQTLLPSLDIRKLVKSASTEYVDVFIPRFKIEYKQQLESVFQKLGATDMFNEDSDLSGIGGVPGYLYVSKIIHQAFLEVNEEGAEAAAATAVVACRENSYPAKPEPIPKMFRADHPFVAFIFDRKLRTTVFAGRLTQLEPSFNL